MKTILALALLSTTAFAQRTPPKPVTIDDLGVMNLHVRQAETILYFVHGPNAWLGTGNSPHSQNVDCLVLDVQHPDVDLSLQDKQAVADKLEVNYGVGLTPRIALKTSVKGENVVFLMPTSRFYVAGLQAKSKEGRSLVDTVKDLLPETSDNQLIPAGLIYVRNCRL